MSFHLESLFRRKNTSRIQVLACNYLCAKSVYKHLLREKQSSSATHDGRNAILIRIRNHEKRDHEIFELVFCKGSKGYTTRQESLIHKEKAIFPFLGGPVNLHGLFASRPGSFRVKVNRNLNCVHGTSYEKLVHSFLASFDRVFALNAGGKCCSTKFTIEANFVARETGGGGRGGRGASFKNEQLSQRLK